MNAEDIIAGCRLFARMAPAARACLVAMAEVHEVEARQVLFRQGDSCPGLFVVGSGMVRVYKLAANGKEHVLHLAGPGKAFAEAAVIGGFPCPAFAEAVEPSHIAVLPAQAFMGFLQSDHRSCIDLLVGISGWLHHMVDLMEDLVLRDASGRLARYLLDRAGAGGRVDLPAAKRLLANHLNLTPETLSRTLRRLDEEGLISSGADALVVRDAQRLRALADGMGPEV